MGCVCAAIINEVEVLHPLLEVVDKPLLQDGVLVLELGTGCEEEARRVAWACTGNLQLVCAVLPATECPCKAFAQQPWTYSGLSTQDAKQSVLYIRMHSMPNCHLLRNRLMSPDA